MGIYELTDRIIDPERYPWGFGSQPDGDCPETLWKKSADTELSVPPVPSVTVSTDVTTL